MITTTFATFAWSPSDSNYLSYLCMVLMDSVAKDEEAEKMEVGASPSTPLSIGVASYA